MAGLSKQAVQEPAAFLIALLKKPIACAVLGLGDKVVPHDRGIPPAVFNAFGTVHNTQGTAIKRTVLFDHKGNRGIEQPERALGVLLVVYGWYCLI